MAEPPENLPDFRSAQEAVDSAVSQGLVGCRAGCALVLLLSLGSTVLFTLSGTPPGAIIGGVLALVSGAVVLYTSLRIQQKETVNYTIEISDEPLIFGRGFRVTVNLVALRDLPLTTGELTLRCREHAINRGGTTDSHFYHICFEDKRPQAVNMNLSQGNAWSLTETFTIPPGLPCSYSGRNNHIEWQLVFKLGLKGILLDLSHERAVWVEPIVA